MTRTEVPVQPCWTASWAEGLYGSWAAFFYGVKGDLARADSLCELGMRVVSGEFGLCEATRFEFVEIALAKIAGEASCSSEPRKSPTRFQTSEASWLATVAKPSDDTSPITQKLTPH